MDTQRNIFLYLIVELIRGNINHVGTKPAYSHLKYNRSVYYTYINDKLINGCLTLTLAVFQLYRDEYILKTNWSVTVIVLLECDCDCFIGV